MNMKFLLNLCLFFLHLPVLADNLIIQNILNDCGNGYSYSAVYEINSYNCSPGTYLPAGAISCEICPYGHTCSGGVFNFSATQTQGLDDGDIIVTDVVGSCGKTGLNQNFSAIYEINSYDCNVGTYLPADGIVCEVCPTGYTCNGGKYTYNPDAEQGKTPNIVTLNFDDGSGNITNTTCVYDDIIILPEPPSRPGYVFNGWKVNNTQQ